MPTLPGTSSADTGSEDGGRIGSITYRSRANGTPSRQEIEALTRAAQQRNRSAGLTGTLFYEDGRFFQCIEGPPETLEPVWNSIRRDPRHRDIRVLSMRVGPARLFAGWDMQWLRRGQQAAPEDAIAPGPAVTERVAPAERLARLALDDDAGGLAAELNRKHARAPLALLLDDLIEPAARTLGDAWMRDDIDDLALMLALNRLNQAVHDRASRDCVQRGSDSRVLAATAPGETHLLGAIATAELHINAGWRVDLEFPKSIEELLRLVSRTAYDRVDIASSDAVDRDGVRAGAEALASRIAEASLKPDVEVSFGGRAFWAEDAQDGLPQCRFRWSAADHRV
jgi:hypothetical protein